jgi:hypothetical protein
MWFVMPLVEMCRDLYHAQFRDTMEQVEYVIPEREQRCHWKWSRSSASWRT